MENESTFQPITTQEEFNLRLRETLQAVREQYADYDSLKAAAENRIDGESVEDLNEHIETTEKAIESLRAEYEAAKKTMEENERKLKVYETRAQRAKIAKEYGIPYDLMERLQGETEEEIREDARHMAELIGSGSGRKQPETVVLPLADLDGGGSADGEWKELLRRLNASNGF